MKSEEGQFTSRMKKPFTHYLGGTVAKDSWMVGIVGGLIRGRGLALNAVLALITMGTPWWWPSEYVSQYTISVPIFAAVTLSSGGGLLFAGFYYLRKRTIRSLRTKYMLHTLAHHTRDHQTKIYQAFQPNRPPTQADVTKQLHETLDKLCQDAAEYFKVILNDESIAASIRLAVPDSDPAVKLAYQTVARSSGLSSSRCTTSEPIPANQGIARFLREEKDSLGVLIYHNIKASAAVGAYKLTKNDRNYPNEVVTMMVAPLNAWDGSKQDMIGLLHISSGRENVFTYRDVDSVLFLADYTAVVISNMMMLARPILSAGRQSEKG